jgi:hypothetical protein
VCAAYGHFQQDRRVAVSQLSQLVGLFHMYIVCYGFELILRGQFRSN